jgi:hypothetical protein
MSWNDVVGSVAITMYNAKATQRWRLIDSSGVDLAPATKCFRIEADPHRGTLAYLTLLVHPEIGVVLDGSHRGELKNYRGVEVEFCYSVRSVQTDHSEAETLVAQ